MVTQRGLHRFQHPASFGPTTPSRLAGGISINQSLSPKEPDIHSAGGSLLRFLSNNHGHDDLAGVGMNPLDFLATQESDNSYLASTRTNLSPNDVRFFDNASACPSLYSGLSAVETSPMTRCSSSFEANCWLSGVDMVHTPSSRSMFANNADDNIAHLNMSAATYAGSKYTSDDQDLLYFGAGALGSQDVASQEFPSSSLDNSLLSPFDSASMERSLSSTSNSSTLSTASSRERRAKERADQVIQNSRTSIAPKPQEDSLTSLTGAATSKEKLPPNKLPYRRRKQPKVFCRQCEKYPDGFRGDHELQRHISAKHSPTVTKWICRDPNMQGINSPLSPKVQLKGCKSCDNGKLYGAYYNAAAHLRRAHFVPKAGRSKSKGANKEEKRGGKAGGSWPAMEDLKLWYEKTTVLCAPVSDEADEVDEAMDNTDEDESLDSGPIDQVLDAYSPTNDSTFTLASAHAPSNISPGATGFLTSTQFSSVADNSDFLYLAGAQQIDTPQTNLWIEATSPWGSVESISLTPPTFNCMGQEPMLGLFPSFD